MLTGMRFIEYRLQWVGIFEQHSVNKIAFLLSGIQLLERMLTLAAFNNTKYSSARIISSVQQLMLFINSTSVAEYRGNSLVDSLQMTSLSRLQPIGDDDVHRHGTLASAGVDAR